jgi:hypothetical protein
MANIAINIKGLTPSQKTLRGESLIEKNTGNSDVSGNATQLAAFTAAQTRLKAAVLDCLNRKNAWDAALIRRAEAEREWDDAIRNLAAITQGITSGEVTKLVGAGWDVRALPTPQQQVREVTGLRVMPGPDEGYSQLAWDVEPNADSYVIERSVDPIGPNTWTYADTVREARCTSNGATPGVKCWYRVRGVNRKNKGPWSEPAVRPVM